MNTITFLWLAAWACYAVRCLARGDRHSILFVIIILFVFCGVPLAADVIVGCPEYAKYPGFYDASRDGPTSIIYCLYVSSCVLIWWFLGIGDPTKVSRDRSDAFSSPVVQVLCYVLMLLPLVAVFLAPNPSLYAHYGAALDDSVRIDDSVAAGHTRVTLACQAAFVGAACLLLWPKRANLPLILVGMVMLAWLHGKRNIVAMELLVLFYAAWRKGHLRGSRLLAVGCSVAIVLGAFSYFYQVNMRFIAGNDTAMSDVYQNVRLDYGRDDVIKLAIYSELYPDQGRILEYRGQSLLFYSAIFIPREVWPEKPWPYAVYVTARMLENPPRSLGWSMTTSVLEEAIANCGWIGMFLGPVLIALICRIGDSCEDRFIQALTVMNACLLLAVHLAAFWTFMLAWVAMVAWSKSQTTAARSRRVVRDVRHEEFCHLDGAERSVHERS
ncbi:MAG: hypothetical protein NTW96_20000 [Planctomycetia bacterium]|nr:hypothetical protein [Planctomycetia bacterium]